MMGTRAAAPRAPATSMVAPKAVITPVAEGTETADPGPEKTGRDQMATEAPIATVGKVRIERRDRAPFT